MNIYWLVRIPFAFVRFCICRDIRSGPWVAFSLNSILFWNTHNTIQINNKTMDRKTSCIATYTNSAPWYRVSCEKNTLHMIKIVRVNCWVNISNTWSFIIIWNNVRGRKIEIEWREGSHTHGLTREIKRQYHRLSIKSFCRNNNALDT